MKQRSVIKKRIPNNIKKVLLRYIIQIWRKGYNKSKNYKNGTIHLDFEPDTPIGFNGGDGKIFTQYFNGKGKGICVVLQTPKLFKSKRDCLIEIKRHKKEDKAFGQKYFYRLIPLNINE